MNNPVADTLLSINIFRFPHLSLSGLSSSAFQ